MPRKKTGKVIECEECGEEFYVTKSRLKQTKENGNKVRYCSMECYNKNRPTGEENPAKSPEVRKKISESKKGEKNPIHKINQSGERNPNWKGGRSFEDYPKGWSDTLKEKIRNRDNRKCYICGKKEKKCLKKYNRKLHIHHTSLDKKNIDENYLVSLCVSCHVKLHKQALEPWSDKINIGAGKDHRNGYINLDVNVETNPDIPCNVKEIPFPDNSFSEAIGQDILEHFKNPVKILKEIHRVLKSDGIILIRVPDFEKCIDKDFIENTPFYRTENRILGGRDNEYDIHKSLFTKRVLRERMGKSGFKSIVIKRSKEPPLHWHLLAHGEKKI